VFASSRMLSAESYSGTAASKDYTGAEHRYESNCAEDRHIPTEHTCCPSTRNHCAARTLPEFSGGIEACGA
jgi:hypothetical protein